MPKHLRLSLVGVSLSLAATQLLAAEPGDLLGLQVMLVAPDVTFRHGPSLRASVAENPTGGALKLTVDATDEDWLRIHGKWLRRDQVTPLEAAVTFFTAQIDEQPTPFALVSRSEAWLEQSEIEKAISDVQSALELDPKCAMGYCTRANIRLIGANLEEALLDFDKAVTLEPKLSVALKGRILVHRLLYSQFAALADRDAAVGSKPDFDKLALDSRRSTAVKLFVEAQHIAGKRKHREAIAALDEAVRLAPELRAATFYCRRSHQYFMLGEFDAAAADLREAISLEPESAAHHEALGTICKVQNDWDGAIEHFSRAYVLCKAASAKKALPEPARGVSLQPDYLQLFVRESLLEAHLERANRRSTRNDWVGAMADLDSAVELDAKSSYALVRRAFYLAQIGEFDRAFKDCDAAINLDQRSSFAWCSRGAVHQAKGDIVKAIDALSEAVERFPREAAPLLARADVWSAQGELKRALEDLDRAIVLEPGNAFCYAQRAEIFRELKRDGEAAADLKKANELTGDLGKQN